MKAPERLVHSGGPLTILLRAHAMDLKSGVLRRIIAQVYRNELYRGSGVGAHIVDKVNGGLFRAHVR